MSEILHYDDAQPTTAVGRWMRGPEKSADDAHAHDTSPWYRVLWLTGVDYFSTLGYQPGIALLAAGAIAPLATSILVLITLFGAVPMYREVARRSYQGQGSISMLERLLPGWWGKLFILGLVGFAATAFIITMTLSAADAALHVVENPVAASIVGHAQVPITIAMLVALGVVFLRGFREAIGVAAWIAVPYLFLNIAVLGRGFMEIAAHPAHLSDWKAALALKGDPTALALLAVVAFPKLALGLSGFETGVTVMPLVRGDPGDATSATPIGRIRATERLLLAAALIMSGMLIGSSLVTTLLIPEEAWREGGPAAGRALAWLAHTYLGPVFGTAYDVSTILILWFAGASAMAALLNIIPQYLPRFGMAPQWVGYVRPLILLITVINVIVTIAFDAQVEEQGGAYATGVLALFLSAAIAVTLALRAEARAQREGGWKALPYAIITLIFGYTFTANIVERPDGLYISFAFILSVMVLGAWSRWNRATELRVEKLTWATPESEALFESIRGRKVHIVTIKDEEGVLKQKRSEIGRDPRFAIITSHKERVVRHYNVDGAFCFVHLDLAQDRSAFDTSLHVRISRIGDDYLLIGSNAVAVANAIAYLSERIDPISIFLGLTQENPMRQAMKYMLWGEGETGILVYQILQRYWDWTPEHDLRPNIYLMSESNAGVRTPSAPGAGSPTPAAGA